MGLLDLPPELVTRILCLLALPDLSACLLTHSALRALIAGSVLVRYHIATQLAGVEDNPAALLSVQERLERLGRLEEGWAALDVDFVKRVQVGHDPSGIYDLTGGIYLLGNRSRRALHYCTLPSREGDEPRWGRIDVDASIIDMGLDVYEHDLVAVVTTTRQSPTSNMHNLEIVLLQLSTGQRHPAARTPRIFVAASRWARPAIGIEIVGDTLALITTHYQNPFNPPDDFYIFDWKAGTLRMHTTAPNNSYAGLLFLTPTLLLLPNNTTHTLEFWDARPSPTYLSTWPLGALALPPLSAGHAISGISCRCEPNPVAGAAPPLYARHLPFRAAPGEAVAIFNVRVHEEAEVGAGAGLGLGLGTTFSMFVRREALVGLCPVGVGVSTGASADGDGDGDVGANMEEGGEGGGGGGEGTERVEVVPVPWDAWGPDATRWLNADVLSARWITKTAGARAAVMVENVGAVVIMDFHPARVRLAAARMGAGAGVVVDVDTLTGTSTGTAAGTGVQGETRLSRGYDKTDLHTWVETGELAIVHPAFAGRVVSRLGYCARMLARVETYEGLLMDEERMIGLVTDEFGSRIREIVIHHLGRVDDGGGEAGVGDGEGEGGEGVDSGEGEEEG